MITVSIVSYHQSYKEMMSVLNCVINSIVSIIYIVDNSKNDSLRILEKESKKIRYIHNQNIGYGGAHNIAIREAIEKGSIYHIVMNPDIYFDSSIIEKITRYMEENVNVGQVMPKVFYPNGELQYLCKMIPTPVDLIFKRFFPKQFIEKRMNRFQLKFTGYNKEMNIPYLSGCFMFFRTIALQDIGFFDEKFFMYPEDIDLTRRMHEKYKTMFYPSVSIVHAHTEASKTNYTMLKIHMFNMIKYFNKWGWIYDKKRKKINLKLLKTLNYK